MEVGLVQKAFWCVRDDSNPLGWRSHELYYLFILLLLPGGLMIAAYGAIAREICRCMRERAQLVATAAANPKNPFSLETQHQQNTKM